MFKKIKRLIALASKDPEALKVLEGLTDEQLKAVPDVSEGDGQAEFFGEGTPEELKELKKEDEGMKPWYDLLNKL